MKEQVLRPTLRYWLKEDAISTLVILGAMGYAIYFNWGADKFYTVLLIVSIITFLVLLRVFRYWNRLIRLTADGMIMRTKLNSFFWTKSQIEAADFYLSGKEDDVPYMLLCTDQNEHEFSLAAYNSDDVEDGMETWLGRELIGEEAVKQSQRRKLQLQKRVMEWNEYGNSEQFVGGRISRAYFLHLFLVPFFMAILGTIFLVAGAPLWFSVMFFVVAVLWLVGMGGQYGSVFMNRDHIVTKRWGRTSALAWRDVEHVEYMDTNIVFVAGDKRLVAPGHLYWAESYKMKMSAIYGRQMNQRKIYVTGETHAIPPNNRGVKTADPTFRAL